MLERWPLTCRNFTFFDHSENALRFIPMPRVIISDAPRYVFEEDTNVVSFGFLLLYLFFSRHVSLRCSKHFEGQRRSSQWQHHQQRKIESDNGLGFSVVPQSFYSYIFRPLEGFGESSFPR